MNKGKLATNITVLFFLICAGFYFRTEIENAYYMLRADYFPCTAPIQYSLGEFDTRFGISKKEFLADIKSAEDIWEKAVGKDLFNYDESANLKINLLYDYRQQATEKLKKLGLVVESNQNSYDQLKAKYDALHLEYETLKISYETRLAKFNTDKDVYEKEVAYWNTRGGAPKSKYDDIQAEENNLKIESEELKKMQIDLNNLADQINALVVVLNDEAKNFNITAREYNKIGLSLPEEFEEGLYTRQGFTQKIDIFEFSSNAKLIRVLIHEFGHALGLSHVDDPKAIMYKSNQGESKKLSVTDIDILKTRCGIK